jgi:hypothetical protein
MSKWPRLAVISPARKTRARGRLVHDRRGRTHFSSSGAVFDPKTIAVLTAAYGKAIEGQSASVREVIAKGIIELACESERDADKLCQGALALFILKPRSPSDRLVTASRGLLE